MYQTLVEKSSFSEDEVIFKRGCVGVCVLFAKNSEIRPFN